MPSSMNEYLHRWQEAGLLEEAQVAAILRHESSQPAQAPARLRWPAILAIAFGTLLVGAGTLLFVAAHWDAMGPAVRFLMVLVQVAAFHIAGVYFAERMPRLAMALHGLGTLTLGAGIFLAGQIFHLQEHWPGALLLWAVGAWAGYWLLRDWVQGLLAALLTPGWLAGEWMEATRDGWSTLDGAERILAVGFFTVALTYFTMRRDEEDAPLQRALTWVGGIAFVPAVLGIVFATEDHGWWRRYDLPGHLSALGWLGALGLPFALAIHRRGKRAWMNGVALLWAAVFGFMGDWQWQLYAWCALGAVGLICWGLHEGRRERINLGIAGFAITVTTFYFADVMDKLGRSLGLLGLGVLFLLGGWQMERLRRRLNERVRHEA